MTKRWGGSVRVAVGVVVGVLAMAGCTGEPGPIVTHDVTSTWTPPAVESPTPSPTISPTADVDPLAALPEDARCDLLTCAKETAEYFLLEQDRVLETGDLTTWNALSLDECAYCASVRENVTLIFDDGNHVVGAVTTFDENSWRYELDTDTGEAFVVVDKVTTPKQMVDSAGAVVQEIGEQRGTSTLSLVFFDGAWRVSGVSYEAAS